MVTSILHILAQIIIYFWGDDPQYGMDWYYINETFYSEMGPKSKMILTGVAITTIFIKFYYTNL